MKGLSSVIRYVRHSPSERESLWQVFFDGNCALCRESSKFLAKKVAGWPVVFVDGHAAGLPPGEFKEIRVCTPEGKELRGFSAVVRLLALRGRWPWLWRTLLRPPFLTVGNWGYRLVAKYRHYLA